MPRVRAGRPRQRRSTGGGCVHARSRRRCCRSTPRWPRSARRRCGARRLGAPHRAASPDFCDVPAIVRATRGLSMACPRRPHPRHGDGCRRGARNIDQGLALTPRRSPTGSLPRRAVGAGARVHGAARAAGLPTVAVCRSRSSSRTRPRSPAAHGGLHAVARPHLCDHGDRPARDLGPVGFTPAGLPVGLQIVGGGDARPTCCAPRPRWSGNWRSTGARRAATTRRPGTAPTARDRPDAAAQKQRARRRERSLHEPHARFLRQPRALAPVARDAGRDDVLPRRVATARARHAWSTVSAREPRPQYWHR